MTAGYGAGDGVPGQGTDETADHGPGEPSPGGRPGPLPPRIARPAGHAQVPGQTSFPMAGSAFPAPAGGPPPAPEGFPVPAPTGPPSAPGGFAVPAPTGPPPAPDGFPASPATAGPSAGQPGGPGQPAVPAPRATWSPTPNSGQWGGPGGAPTAPRAQDGWPPATAPGQSTATVPGQPTGPAPGQPLSGSAYPGQSVSGSAYPGQSVSGSAYPGQPVSGPAYPGQLTSAVAYPGQPVSGPVPAQPGHPAARRRRLPVLALVLAGLLAVVAGVQAYQIHRLGDRLAATDRRLTEVQGAAGTRFDGLEQRAGALEKQAGAAFNPEAVASAVLPSVFRVRAGDFTGTAFAVGKPPAGGGTTLLTNFHVVESVYDGGGRKVFLERSDQRFEATIVRVDKDKDIAQLRTSARFKALVAASTPVKSGQQIVVVGAPLGLQDTVTTGVVSAFRKEDSGPVIQFDAPINPGNSGGPVINGSKEVVGIATAKARDAEGIGLAVPIKTACDTFSLC
ncbi:MULTISPECIES: trypsin-like peptidase domain-containing protein [Micromonospora]|uniref:Peptidase S1 n=1 Tax=Micromonospora solifontis TaxID=2487138 RepID=A0ABX9WM13_9ACTN|nr:MULTISPECIES: trypsin-like peptidase domain-containing protein [Micromonospora]NES12924.1 trypsin-like serine protease [Micromonospora sp. PPF5-17B]NES34758.1 trypsin-like serine protease [Micromonospora solifontis]NES54849.1 trypsin-like serine protease [Micromonospora sp. PPF5-6]RNM01661.1 peptidase S1 [Micromonospora solifontis]